MYNDTKLLPEYASGSDDALRRQINRKIVVYDRTLADKPITGFSLHQICQGAQEVQAWTAAAVLAIKYQNGFKLRGGMPIINATETDKKLFEAEILASIQ